MGAMGISGWIAQNWFDFLQTVGIVGGLVFTGIALRTETKVRRVENLLTITEGHRKIWAEFYERAELKRVLDENANIHDHEITREEEIFVNFVIFHLNSVFYARKSGLVFKLDGLRRDVRWFLLLPIPGSVWTKTKALQNDDFVAFVESCLASK